MYNTNILKDRSRKIPLRAFGMFAITFLLSVSITWWFSRNYYNHSEATNRAFLRLDSSLNIANKFLINACSDDSIYVSSKSHQPGFEKVLILYKPKIDSVMLIARRMHNYIQAIKLPLNLNVNQDNEILSNSQQTISMKLISNEVAKSLYDTLNYYSHLLFNILPFKIAYYKFATPIDTSNPFSKTAEIWRKNYFDELTGPTMLSSLTELDYQVWLSANKMTNIIRSQWSDLFFEDFSVYRPLVSQNSMYFLPGQTLEISVGLGKYSTDIKPKISINGQQQPLNAYNIALYKKVMGNEKKSSIPIIITFTDPATGKQMTVSQTNYYSVLNPAKN